jgi:hypothetical protein
MRGWQSPAIDALALLIAVLAVSLASTATRCAWQAASAIAEAEAARPIAEADRDPDNTARSGQPRPAHPAEVTANALRYSPAGSPPLLTASAHDHFTARRARARPGPLTLLTGGLSGPRRPA